MWRPRVLRAAVMQRGLFLVLLIILAAAPGAPASSPGAYFENLKTYRAHNDDFKYGFAAGMYDVVSMFAAIAQGPGITNSGVTKLFQCLDQQGAQLDQLTGWMRQVAQKTADTTVSMISVIAPACGAPFVSTGSYFDHVSTFKGDTPDYQRGYAAGFYDAVSQWANAAQSPLVSVNNLKTVAAWRCLDGKGSKLGELRAWVDTTVGHASDNDVIRSLVLAACQGSVADLSAPISGRNPFVPTPSPTKPSWTTYWYIPAAAAAVALGIFGLSRSKGIALPGKAILQRRPVDAQPPSPPAPVEVVQADDGIPSVWDDSRDETADRPERQESPPQPRVQTGLWLWVPGRSPLGLALGSRVSAQELGGSPGAVGAEDVAALVEPEPGAPQRFQLRNLSGRTWRVRGPGADWSEVTPGAVVPLVPGTIMMVGEVRVSLQPWEVQPLRPAWQPRLRIGERLVTVAGDLQLYEYDLAGLNAQAADGVVARVSVRSTDDTVLGLQNLSTVTWVATPPDSGPKEIEPGRSIRLRPGMRIVCGTATIVVE